MNKKPNQSLHAISIFQSFFLPCLYIFLSVCLHAQTPGHDISVTGIIKDNNNNALIGASVSIKGTKTGTISDTDGKFALSVKNENEVLVISYTGYANLEIPVHKQQMFDIVLQS